MKIKYKIIIALTAVFLLAAGCSGATSSQSNGSPAPAASSPGY